RDRIIVALDCAPDEALGLARRLSGEARWLKVGMTLYYAQGPTVVAALKELGYQVFVDLKLHDIPHQVRGAAASLVRAGADMLTVHASGGLEMLVAALEGIESAALPGQAPISLAITVLTSLDAAALNAAGVADTPAQQAIRLAGLAKGAGLSGVVASPLEAADCAALLGPAAEVVTPGVRPRGAALDDQSRVATPAAALAAGATRLVIGRPITNAPDPLAAYREILRELEDEA
ncbi:MAG: orotidine-5'-phosphate decarboxylase, partial [Coriobacteriia bacterium]|nr:orotidine-5'-phosphate decarboxylase [Coriobacteriia bacterium]